MRHTKNQNGNRFSLIIVLTIASLAIFHGCGESPPDFTVSGTVLDASSGLPIAGARVSDGSYGPEPRQGAVTDSTGKYAYLTWAEEHNVTAAASGYKIQTENLNPWPAEREMTLDFRLVRE